MQPVPTLKPDFRI